MKSWNLRGFYVINFSFHFSSRERSFHRHERKLLDWDATEEAQSSIGMQRRLKMMERCLLEEKSPLAFSSISLLLPFHNVLSVMSLVLVRLILALLSFPRQKGLALRSKANSI